MSKVTPDGPYPIVQQLANRDSVVRHEPVYTLAEMLNLKKISELRELWRLYGVKEPYKASKAETIPLLAGKMMDKDRLMLHLQLLKAPEWDLFRKAAKAEHLIDEESDSMIYLRLHLFGLLGVYRHDSRLYFVVPSEIKQMYNSIEELGFPAQKEHADLLNDYAVAAVNLYGVISQDDFVEIFNSQNELKTDVDEMFGLLLLFVTLEYGYVFWEDYIVNDEFGEDDYKDVEFCVKTAAGKPRYLPEREEFLKYSDWNYIEKSPDLDKLRYYFGRDISKDEALTEKIVNGMHFLARREAEMQEYMELLEENKVFPDIPAVKVLIDLIVKMANNTRLWINNGHTAMELKDGNEDSITPPGSRPVRVVKVGRNEPCPCGSGLKYKKCCGE